MPLRTLAVLILLLVSACGGLPGNVVVLIPDENGSTGKVLVSNQGQTAELAKPYAAVETDPGHPPGDVIVAKQEDVTKAFSAALAATPRAPTSYIVYFATGQAVLDAAAKASLDTAIAAAKATSNVDISVVGHADVIGTDADNQPLSLRRAETVRDALVAGGVPAGVIEVAYHGSHNPRVPNQPGVAEPLNRRVEITVR